MTAEPGRVLPARAKNVIGQVAKLPKAPKATVSFGGPSFVVPNAAPPALQAPPPITATLRDSLAIDTNADGQPGPDDTLTYTATINAGATDATGVTFSAPLDTNTTLVPGSVTATPVGVNDSYAANRDTALTRPAATGVLINDFAGLPAATVTGFQTPTPHGGTVTIAADGGFTYTPASGYTGPDSFTYTITNAAGSDTATVSLDVLVPALATDDTYAVIKDTTLSVPAPGLLTNDVGTPAPTVTAATGPTPQGGTVTVNADGSFTYTPPAGFVSPPVDTFSYTITNSAGTSSATANLTVDARPGIDARVPVSGATNVPTDTNITVTFSEPVMVTAQAFALTCPGVTPVAFVNITGAGPATAFVLDPSALLPANATCTVSVVAAEVADADPTDPPDHPLVDDVFTFSTDAAPQVNATSPVTGASDILINTNLAVTFSESVNVTGNWFQIACSASGTRNVADTAVNTVDNITFTIDPTVDFTPGDNCTTTVFAAQVSDTDTNDPPDTMAANHVFTFATDQQATVSSTIPAAGAISIATNTNLTIAFSEPVNVTGNWFQIVCASSGTRNVADTNVSGGPTYVIDPATDFAQGELCTVTVFAANVTDVDANDPPDAMAADHVFAFTLESAPSIVTSVPADNAVNRTTTENLILTFSEPVTVTGNWFQIVCTVSGTRNPADTLVTGGPTTWTIDPTTNFTQGESCTATVFAAGVTDQDAVDPPDTMTADVVIDFTIDAQPSVTVTAPVNGATDQVTTTDLTITFSEPVNVTGSWFTISCTTSGAHTAAVTGGPQIFTLNPTADFTQGETCTTTVVAALVSDQDADDPPDTPAADHVFTFSIDVAPTVIITLPANGAVNVPVDANVAVTFNESVNVTGNWFQIVCTISGTRDTSNASVSGGPAVYAINPTADFAPGESCTATVFAALVGDQDANDPPDLMLANHVWTFATDQAPSVTTTTPSNGAVSVVTNTNIDVTFSEPVTAALGSFTVTCTVSGANTFALSGGPLTYTLNPTDFTPGEVCTVTVLAAQVTDQDANDPPDTMLADYVFSFTLENAPSVTATVPVNSAVTVPTTQDLTITFSEPVTPTGNWFQIVCATSGTRNVADTAVSGGPATFTINPTLDFATGELCTVTVFAAQVADQDAIDPPDTMLANHAFSFTTDEAPSVTATTPANGASGQVTNTDLTITFSEPVNVTGTWFTLSCTTSGAHTAVASGGPTTFTLNPDADFAAGETCLTTIVAAQVSDQDAGDPPDTPAADYVFTFSIDAAPSVTATVPADGASGVALNANVSVTFSEGVTLSFSVGHVACTVSGIHSISTDLMTGGPTTWTINLATDLAPGETCNGLILTNAVHDEDANDPPDTMVGLNYLWTFTTDAAPSVTTTTPSNGAVSVVTNANIDVTFSEPVNAVVGSFTLNCTVSGANTFALSGGPTTYTLNPTTDFTPGEVCTVTVLAAQVTDQDANDPPDNPLADYVFSFTLEDAPSVTATVPVNGAVTVSTTQDLTITFGEPVTPTGNWFQIVCATSGTRNVADTAVSGGPTTFTINPTVDFASGEVCTVTVFAAQVADQDAIDPPDTMAANHVFSFTTDVAPSVTATTPTNGATDQASNANLTITFSEPVNVTATAFALSCTTSGAHTAVVSGGPTTFTLNPDADFTQGETCTTTVLAAQVSDQDAGDPPDTPAADYVFSFVIDAAPSVTATVPADTASGVVLNADLTVTFSEAVDVTGPWFTITCSVSGVHSGAVSGGATTFTINPAINFAPGESCTAQVIFNQVSDQDANDPPDTMVSTYTWSFSTDAAPSVAATTPANGAVSVLSNANVDIMFSEPINAVGGSFTLSCTLSGTHTSVLSSSDNVTWTLNPDTDFAPGEVCTVTALAVGVTDSDLNDPPDNMLADYVFSFTIEAAPFVQTSVPAAAGTLGTTQNLTLTFNEPVDATGNWFQLVCATSGTQNVADTDVTGGPTTFTINPNADLVTGESCTLTVFAAQVADQDSNDPPDLMTADAVIPFTIDVAPTVLTTDPLNGATNGGPAQNLTITFSEPVNVTGNWFQIVCTTSGTRNVSDTGVSGGPTTFTIDPNSDFISPESCTVTVFGSQVTDQDSADPPDTMTGDFVFSFATDSAPSVSSTTPPNGAVDAPGNTNVSITFSEPVNVTATWFQIACPTSGTRTPANSVVTGGPTTFNINPNVDFASAELCTTTVFAANVTDVDANDPPDNMAADYSFSFTIDAAPQVTTTVPANGATNLAANTTITINFSEPVNVAAGGVTIGCPGAVTFTPALPQGNQTSLVLTPTTPLPSAATCTVTVVAANIHDVDTNDPPDLLDGNGDGTPGDNFVFAFTVDAAPRVTLPTSPANGATNQATNINLTINFSEPVDLAVGAVTLGCPAAVPFTPTPAFPATNTTSVVLDPTSDLPTGATCTVTVVAANTTDTDTNDPPDQLDGNGDGVPGDNHVFSFTTDAAPRVNTPTTPANGAVNVAPASNITIAFSELVNIAAGGITVECPVSTPIAFTPTLPQLSVSSIVIDPSTSLPGNETCTVTVVATGVTDVDANDPPDQLDGNADSVPGDNHVFAFTVAPEAVNDSYTASPHLTLTVPAVTGVKANDLPPSLTITGFGNTVGTANGTVPNGTNTITTTLGTGGVVTLNADGSFTYIPPPDVVNTPDHFFYTVTGGDTADVTVSIQNDELIWFVDASYAGANGTSNGTQARPFTSLTGAGSFDASALPDNNTNDTVFIKQGSYTCGLTLINTQKIVGDGSSSDLATISGVTPVTGSSLPAFTGTDPTLSVGGTGNCLAVGTGNTIRGVTLAPTAGGATAISGTAVGTLTMLEDTINGVGGAFNITTSGTLDVTLDRLTSTGSTGGVVALTGVGGTMTVNEAGGNTTALSGATNAPISISGGAVSLTYAGDISSSTTALVSISGGHTGTLTFDGSSSSLSATGGTGLQFNNADGIYNFNTTAGTTALNGGDAGIDIIGGSSGTFTFGRSATPSAFAITSPSGTALNVNGGTAGITYHGDITQANNAAMVAVAGGHATGTISFQDGALSATNGTGLQFDNADGTYSFETSTGSTTLNGGDAGIDITNGSAGGFTFGRTATPTAFVITKANAGNALTIDGTATAVTSAVTYNGNITQSNTGAMVSVTAHSTGTVQFQAGALSATNGTGLQFTNADGTYNFNVASGTTALNGGDAGIDILTGSGGTFAFGGTAITNPSGVALNVDGSTTAVTGGISISGAISKTSAGRLIDFNNYDTGTATISGSLSCITSCQGLEVTNDGASSGTVTFSNATKTLNTGATTAVNLDNNDGGTVNFTNGGLNIDTTSGSGFVAINGGVVNVSGATNNVDTQGGTALDWNGDTSTGTVTFNNVNSTTGGAVSITSSGATDFTFNDVTSTTGTAVSITTATGDFTFHAISSNGGAKGISVNSATGTFVVNGTSTTDGTGGTIQNKTNRGGEFISSNNITLKNMNFLSNGDGDDLNCGDALNASTNQALVTSAACESNIHLQSVTTAVLDNVSANDGGAHGINGVAVNGLTLTNVDVLRNGSNTLVGEDGVQLVNPTGTITVTNGIYRDNSSRSFEVQNNTGSPTINIDGAFFGNTNFPQASGTVTSPNNSTAASTLMLATNGNNGAFITSVITDSTFQKVFSIAFHVDMGDGNNRQNVTFGTAGHGNSITTATQGITMVGVNDQTAGGTKGLVASVVNNVINNDETLMDTTSSTNINFRRGGGVSAASGDWDVTVDNNVVGINGNSLSGCEVAGCNGITADDQGSTSGTFTVLIQNNQVYRVYGAAIQAGKVNTGATLRATIINNTVDDPETAGTGASPAESQGPGILAFSGTGASGSTYVRIEDNNVDGGWDSVGANGNIRVRTAGAAGSQLFLCNFVLASGSANVVSHLTTENPLSSAPGGFTVASASIGAGLDVDNGCPLILAEDGMEAADSGEVPTLTPANVDHIGESAIARLTAAGLSPAQLDGIRKMTFEMADLPDAMLAETAGDRLRINADTGRGRWFVDPTPDQDEEFGPPSPTTGERLANPDGPAAGRIDLLSAVMHEMGHAGGDRDLDPRTHAGELMAATLPIGARRGPLPVLATASRSNSVDASPMLAGETVTVNVGTLPAGKSVVITYRATIATAPITGPGFALTTQGAVTGTNFTTIITDDPDTAVVDDATRTAMACPVITIEPADIAPVLFAVAMTPVTFTATGGIGTTTLALTGALPSGVTFDSASATLSGTPVDSGSFALTVTATDQNGCETTKSYTLQVGGGRIITTGADVPMPPQVRRFTSGDGLPVDGPTASFLAAGLTGGVRVAEADMTGDGTPDIIAATGPGAAPRVVIFDGVTGAVVSERIVGSASDLAGLFVAAGDVDGDGRPDLITGAGSSPTVRVFSGATGAPIWTASAFAPPFGGGVTVAAGDIDGDGHVEIIAGAGAGNPSMVRIFSGGPTHAELRSFAPYPGFLGGVWVASGDVNGDGYADVITGAGAGGGPHVRVFDGFSGAAGIQFLVDGFAASGVRVAAGDVNGDGRADIITAPGPGGSGVIRVFNGVSGAPLGPTITPSGAATGGYFVSTAILENRMVIDVPASGGTVSDTFRLSGWVFEEGAPGTGVDAVDVWAFPATGGSPTFLGAATLGDPRPDVGAIFGARYTPSGYHLDVSGLAGGQYDVAVYARSSVSGHFNTSRVVRVRVVPPGTDVRVGVDIPPPGKVSRRFRVAGFAFDATATGPGSGVDAVDVWAMPRGAMVPIYLGAATLGDPRPDLASPQSGFHLDVPDLAPGEYLMAVFAKAAVRSTFADPYLVNITVVPWQPVLQMRIDLPGAGVVGPGEFHVGGWALVTGGPTTPGIDAVHVWAYPVGGGAPVFVGEAILGGARPDVALLYGPGYENTGFNLLASLPAGTWDLAVFARMTGAGGFSPAQTMRIIVP